MNKHWSIIKLLLESVFKKLIVLTVFISLVEAALVFMSLNEYEEIKASTLGDNLLLIIPLAIGLFVLFSYVLQFKMSGRCDLTLRRLRVSPGMQAVWFWVISMVSLMVFFVWIIFAGYIASLCAGKFYYFPIGFNLRLAQTIIYILCATITAAVNYYTNVYRVMHKASDLVQIVLLGLFLYKPDISDWILIFSCMVPVIITVFYNFWAYKEAEGLGGQTADQASHKASYIANGLMKNAYGEDVKR